MLAATHPALSEDQLQLIAKAVADPRRYEILKKLSSRSPTPCTVMRECIEIPLPPLAPYE